MAKKTQSTKKPVARQVKVAAVKAPRKPRAPRVAAVLEAPVAVKKVVFKIALPIFEKKRVIAILDSGHTKTHFHCKMDNGTTMHVPKRLFV